MQYANIITRLIVGFVMVFSLYAVSPVTVAQSQTPSDGLRQLNDQSEGIEDLGINANSREDIVDLIAEVIDWALYISGAIAVIFVIVGGYRYLTAGGNEETATKGRQTVVNALIGLVIIILAYVIVNAVVGFIQD